MSESSTKKIIGTWTLDYAEFLIEGRDKLYPFGKNPMGLLIYGDKYMSAQVMDPNRAHFKKDDPRQGTHEEIKEAFEGYLAYYGTYELKEKEGIVSHYVAGSMFPNIIGGVENRFFSFSGDNLILRTPPMDVQGKRITGELSWKRIT